MRARRRMLGITQGKLGEALGLTFQQIQKYERGSNRIGSSRLYEMANILSVPVSYFFEDADIALEEASPTGFSDQTQKPYEVDSLSQREANELIHHYAKLKSQEVRRSLMDLIKALEKNI